MDGEGSYFLNGGIRIMKKAILILLTALLIPFIVEAQSFSPAQKRVIEENANRVIQRYTIYGTLTENTSTISLDYVEVFSELFTSPKTQVYQDASLPNVTTNYLEVSDYIQRLQAYYPEGIVISLENKKFGEPYLILSDGNYQIDLYATKFISGYTKEETIMSEEYPLVFSIRFDKQLKNFTIHEIRLQEENPPDLATNTEPPASNEKPIEEQLPTEETSDIPVEDTEIEVEPYTPPVVKEEPETPPVVKEEPETPPVVEVEPTPTEPQEDTEPEIADIPITEPQEETQETRVRVKAKKEPKEKDPEKEQIKKEKKEFRQMVGQTEGRGLFVKLNLGLDLGNTQVDVSNLSSTYQLSTSSPLSPFAKVGLVYFINQNIGFGFGLGYRSYATQINLDQRFEQSENGFDIDNDEYIQRNYLADNIKEKYAFPFIEGEISLNFKYQLNERIGIFANIGGQRGLLRLNTNSTVTIGELVTQNTYGASFLIDPFTQLTATGSVPIFSYIPLDEAEAEVLDKYDIYNDAFRNSTNYTLSLKEIEVDPPLNLFLEAGLSLSLTNRLKARVGAAYFIGLNKLKEQGEIANSFFNVEQVDIKSEVDTKYESFLQQSNALSTRHLSFQIGLILELDR